MSALFRLLFNLLRLRIGPQDLPWSVPLARALVVASLVFDLATTAVLGAGSAALPRLLLSALLLLGVPWLLLSWRGQGNRYVQTLIALAGTGLLFKLAMLPMALAIVDLPLPETPDQLAPAQVLVGWATLALLSWRMVVTAHIYRHSLDLRFGWALLLVLGLLVLELILAQAFVAVAP